MENPPREPGAARRAARSARPDSDDEPEQPTLGCPADYGELLKLGIEITEPTVAKYMVRQRKLPSQTWRTFLQNQVNSLVSVDFFTVPTMRFQILYVFLVLAHDRRRILHFGVTTHPPAE